MARTCWGAERDSSQSSPSESEEEANSPGACGEAQIARQGRYKGVARLPSGQRRRRVGQTAIVDRDVLTVAAVTQVVNEIGVGRYQWTVCAAVGLSLLAESTDMCAVGPLHAALGHEFDLTSHERSSLTFFTYLGAGFAVLIAGPVTDVVGRKFSVVASVITIGLSFLLLAALPNTSDFKILLALRSLCGSAAGVGGMAGTVLMVESCPVEARPKFVFGITFLGSCGYLLGAWSIALIMPGFGEKPTDNWRLFSVVMGVAPLLSLPFLCCIDQSPLFLAVRGNLKDSYYVLQKMAQMNGTELPPHVEFPERRDEQIPLKRQLTEGSLKLANIFATHTVLIAMLSVIDGARSFMTGGSSYFWKELFVKVGNEGPTLNMVASFAPLIGIAVCYFCNASFKVATRWIAMSCSLLATAGFCFLTSPSVRSGMMPLETFIMMVKLTYGPLVTAVNLMKAEVFPTEVRATVFSMISVVAKVACMFAPTLVEELRGEGDNQVMPEHNVVMFLFILAGASLTCGLVVWWVPDGYDQVFGDLEQKPLMRVHTDPATGKVIQTDAMGRTESVEVANIWSDTSEPSSTDVE